MARKIDDAGELVQGARKHTATRALALADIEGLSAEEAASLTTKDNVWPLPDWKALVADGMPSEVAAIVKIVRDRIAVSPDLNAKQQAKRSGEDVRADYIEMVTRIREVYLDLKSPDQTRAAHDRIMSESGWNQISTRTDPAIRAKVDTVRSRGARRYPYEITYDDLTRAKNMVAAGSPASGPVPAWRRGISVVKDPRDPTKFVALRDRKVLFEGLASEQEGLDKVKEAWEAQRDTSTKEPPPRAKLLQLERQGFPDWRGGRDITPDEFVETFGFRGVQFGESMPDAERQIVVNSAYDGLKDMGHALGLSDRTLSLDGFLAAAFGARGRGRFPAHYEPIKRIYNIGRMNGAGNLAHEWAHAFDHACGEIGFGGASRGDIRYASAAPDKLSGLSLGTSALWDRLMTTLIKRPRTRDEALADARAKLAQSTEIIKRETARFAEYRKRETTDPKLLRRMDAWMVDAEQRKAYTVQRIAALEAASPDAGFGSGPTNFAAEATKLCGRSGDYWKRRHELFARAFECMVADRIEAMGGNSPYLVYGVDENLYSNPDVWRGNPYPTSTERRTFNEILRDLVNACAPAFDKSQEAESLPSPGITP